MLTGECCLLCQAKNLTLARPTQARPSKAWRIYILRGVRLPLAGLRGRFMCFFPFPGCDNLSPFGSCALPAYIPALLFLQDERQPEVLLLNDEDRVWL